MSVIRIESADSTNNWVATRVANMEAPALVYCVEQTAGRGQRGNTWESEPGKNLTASLLLHPEGVAPREQFAISEAVALAVTDLLGELGVEAKVKWPNDIYVGDRKICGILIEHSIMGQHIRHTIAGVGVNVNQREFLSDAPNPVSLVQLTGREHPVDLLAERLLSHVVRRMSMVGDRRLHEEFMCRLWRGEGYHPFRDRHAGETISARIAGIAPEGFLRLETSGGDTREYAFKEVEFVL